MNAKSNSQLKLFLALGWLVITSALILWWMIFAFRLLDGDVINPEKARRMLLMEGATLFILLFVGGVFLISYIWKESKRSEELKAFFAAFSHDLKTSLSSLRLQVESLTEDILDPSHKKTIGRLVTDTSRLQTQVENSFYLGRKERTFSEKILLSDVVDIIKSSWPNLNFILVNNAKLNIDRRALDSILNNIAHNSIIHGKATELRLQVQEEETGRVRVKFTDNGVGFKGDTKSLGEMFYRQNPSSGSGLGLFIIKDLVRAMAGEVIFNSNYTSKGFSVEIVLSGQLISGVVL